MLKFLLKLRYKYSLRTRIIFWLVLLFGVSIVINTFLLYDKYNMDPKIITNEIVKEKIITVTEIKTKIITKKSPIKFMETTTSNMVNKNIYKDKSKTDGENLKLLENGNLNIKLESFEIIERDDGKLLIPELLHGSVNLVYLNWNLDVDLKPQIKYRKNFYDLRIAVMGIVYVDSNNLLKFDSNYFIQKNFKFPFGIKLPVLSDSLNCGIGIGGLQISRPIGLFRNLKLDIGISRKWSGEIGAAAGFSIKL